MNGFIFDIKKFAIHDGPGIRTTVFLKGCPLRCWWCHNPESIKRISKSDESNCQDSIYSLVKKYSAENLIKIIKSDAIFYEESGGGVTFSGGEPLIQIDFLEEILRVCKKEDIHTAIDTSGHVPTESFKRIYLFTDIYLYDIKLFDDNLHKKYTGVSNKLVKKNIEYLSSVGSKVIIRIPLIPEITDTEENLSAISNYLFQFKNILRIDLLPYNKLSEDKYRRLNEKSKMGNIETQSDAKLTEIKSFVQSFGLNAQLNG